MAGLLLGEHGVSLLQAIPRFKSLSSRSSISPRSEERALSCARLRKRMAASLRLTAHTSRRRAAHGSCGAHWRATGYLIAVRKEPEPVAAVMHCMRMRKGSRTMEGTGMATMEKETTSLIGSDKVERTPVYGMDEPDRLDSARDDRQDKRQGRLCGHLVRRVFGMGEDYYPIPWDKLKYDTGFGGYRAASRRHSSRARRIPPQERVGLVR